MVRVLQLLIFNHNYRCLDVIFNSVDVQLAPSPPWTITHPDILVCRSNLI